MLEKNLQALGCPSCKSSIDLVSGDVNAGHIDSGLLSCKQCALALPIVNGFLLCGEARPWNELPSAENWLLELKRTKFSAENSYGEFLQEKQRRGSADTYAAFQPFNESSRALYPFISILKKSLSPGDIILDTWCRTGYTGELLAGLFPEQKVISIWEGDSNVMGYRGFDHWLGSNRRHSNLEVIFTHADKPLPFATDSIKVVHGLDSLHRYEKDIFLHECLRVCKSDGLLIFPHIHLTNSEPKPFFERGCQQYHGREWKDRVDALLEGSNRSCWILPEVELFVADSRLMLTDDHNTIHYNALLLIGASEFDGVELEAPRHLPLTARCRLIQNPLLEIDLNQGYVSKNTNGLGGFAPEMLSRHPCYDQYLKHQDHPRLTNNEIRLLWHSRHGLTLGEIAQEMGLSQPEIKHLVTSLTTREIVHAAPISAAMWALQTFHGLVRLPDPVVDDFSAVWCELNDRYGSHPVIHWLQDGSELMLDDVQFLVAATRAALRDQGIKSSQRIALASAHHPAALILCWACWLESICVVLLDEDQSPEALHGLKDSCEAKWLFTDNPLLLKGQGRCAVLFDNIETDVAPAIGDAQLFSELLETYADVEIPAVKATLDSDAVILFSSGSSGEPKRIVLSQRALCLSGLNMVSTFGLSSERLLSLGPFSMMSGVRNAMVASLISGSTIMLAGRETLMPLTSWSQAIEQAVSVITTVPSWLEIITQAGDRLVANEALHRVLVTGSPLKTHVRDEFMALTGVLVENYYGLTETGGLCIATNDANPFDSAKDGCIGSPAGAVINIVDEQGQLVESGRVGSLRVYSRQLMSRYLDEPEALGKVFDQGWFVTGDLAYWDDGRVFLQGREDDLIKLRNGRRLHPAAIERLLCDLPGVKDAAVLVTAPMQSLLGLVVTEEPLDQLLSAIRKQQPDHNLPDRLKRVSELPYNRNGKLQRHLLHDIAVGDKADQ